jgi:hypothetical protein
LSTEAARQHTTSAENARPAGKDLIVHKLTNDFVGFMFCWIHVKILKNGIIMLDQIPHWQLLIGWTVMVAFFAWNMGCAWGRGDWKKIFMDRFHNPNGEL